MTDPELMPGFAEVRVRIDGTDLRVFTTHLDYRSDPRVRALQVASTLERLGHANVPTVLMGDLNAPPDAPEIAPLFRRLRDAWSDRLEAGFTYPAANPARRIDYILTSEGIGAQHVRVIPTDASDHRAVSADLTIVR
jgi:endonuclease/exonuclease/phosphatase family metal-dependent hydrolase